jgi:GT2 family glycosyltransferase
MSQTPRISVVIACFDQTRELALTLTSFLRQKLSPHLYELIVVDDNSPDHSAREVVARMRRAYPEANLLYVRQHRPDGGAYGASGRVKNIGIRLSRGGYVFFNNSEIVQAGESLSHILSVMDAAGGSLCLRGRVIDLPYEELHGRTQAELEAAHDRADRSRERVATADHAGLAAMPRALLLAVGGNDERFDYWGKEDLDLAARLKRAGCAYVYDERLKSFHISHPPNHAREGDYRRMIALLEENNARELVEANIGHLWGTLTPTPQENLDGTLVVAADADVVGLAGRLEQALYSPGAERLEIIVVCPNAARQQVEEVVFSRFRPLTLIALADGHHSELLRRVLRHVRTAKLAFLPASASFSTPHWDALPDDATAPVAWTALGVGKDGEKADERRWVALTDSLRRLDDAGESSEGG